MGDTGKDFGKQFQAGQTKPPPPPMGAPTRGTVLPLMIVGLIGVIGYSLYTGKGKHSAIGSIEGGPQAKGNIPSRDGQSGAAQSANSVGGARMSD